jgi:hypothetical protein
LLPTASTTQDNPAIINICYDFLLVLYFHIKLLQYLHFLAANFISSAHIGHVLYSGLACEIGFSVTFGVGVRVAFLCCLGTFSSVAADLMTSGKQIGQSRNSIAKRFLQYLHNLLVGRLEKLPTGRTELFCVGKQLGQSIASIGISRLQYLQPFPLK